MAEPWQYSEGDEQSATWLNRLVSWIRSRKVKAVPPLYVDYASDGQLIRYVGPQEADFKITGGAAGKFSGTEQRALAGGGWADLAGGRAATLAADPLFERNGAASIPVGTVVRARRDRDTAAWIFDRNSCSGAASTPTTPTSSPSTTPTTTPTTGPATTPSTTPTTGTGTTSTPGYPSTPSPPGSPAPTTPGYPSPTTPPGAPTTDPAPQVPPSPTTPTRPPAWPLPPIPPGFPPDTPINTAWPSAWPSPVPSASPASTGSSPLPGRGTSGGSGRPIPTGGPGAPPG